MPQSRALVSTKMPLLLLEAAPFMKDESCPWIVRLGIHFRICVVECEAWLSSC